VFIFQFVLPYSTGKSSSEELQLRGRQGGEGVRRVGPQPLHGDRRGQTLRNRTNGALDSGQMLKFGQTLRNRTDGSLDSGQMLKPDLPSSN
jgi:hypothetical protein